MDLNSLLFDQAIRSEQEGDPAQAAQFYGQILRDAPDHAPAAGRLGRLLCCNGAMAQGIDWLSKATMIAPGEAEYWLDLGLALQQCGEREMAGRALRSAASLEPDDRSVLLPLADSLQELGLFAEAVPLFHRIITQTPDQAGAHVNLGYCLLALRRRDEALACFRQALAVDPSHAAAHYNMALILGDRGQNEETIAHYRRALELSPDIGAANLNLAVALFRLTQPEQAIPYYRRALTQTPDDAQTHYNLAHALLQTGQLAEGFAEYEWRWRYDGFPSERRSFTQPQWRGEDVAGKTLLVHSEQGFGDTLQFVRLLPELTARGARVVLECPAVIAGLLRQLEGIEIVETGQPLPPFDYFSPLLSLPYALGLTQPVAVEGGYLRAPQRPGFRQGTAKLHVGLVWAGNPQHGRDHARSLSLTQAGGLAMPPGTTLYSLQHQPPSGWVEAFPQPIIDLGTQIGDFSDLAAAIAAMDLLITVDTATAHLAGALGKPVWTLITRLPDWRWGSEGDTTPWYPSMRLYRQPTTGDWASVLERIANDLAQAARNGFSTP